jgi:hypothetical protein
MSSSKVCFRIAGAALIAFLCAASAAAQTVTVSPSTSVANIGDVVTVNVMVNSITNLRFAKAVVTFDNTIIQLTAVTSEGKFLSTGGTISATTLPTTLSSSVSSIEVNQALLTDASVTGSGVLFTLTFNAVAKGISAVTVSSVDLRNNAVPPSQISVSITSGSVVCGPTVVNAKAWLEGPYSSGSMTTSLRTSGYLPTTQPYSASPWSYNGTESVGVIPAGVVDWVLLELRTGTASGTMQARRAAFIKSDGTIVDVDGTSAVQFTSVTPGTYYIMLRHRNHLAVMSGGGVALTPTSALYDFTTALSKYTGGDAKLLSTGIYGLYGGDADGSGDVAALDRTATWNGRNGVGYVLADVDLSSDVAANDRSLTWNNRNKATQVP